MFHSTSVCSPPFCWSESPSHIWPIPMSYKKGHRDLITKSELQTTTGKPSCKLYKGQYAQACRNSVNMANQLFWTDLRKWALAISLPNIKNITSLILKEVVWQLRGGHLMRTWNPFVVYIFQPNYELWTWFCSTPVAIHKLYYSNKTNQSGLTTQNVIHEINTYWKMVA